MSYSESVYEGMIAQHKIVNEHLRALLAECREVLEFYGDAENWVIATGPGGEAITIDFCEDDGEPYKKAREMLGKLGEVK